jgi:hypothetical protein
MNEHSRLKSWLNKDIIETLNKNAPRDSWHNREGISGTDQQQASC